MTIADIYWLTYEICFCVCQTKYCDFTVVSVSSEINLCNDNNATVYETMYIYLRTRECSFSHQLEADLRQ